MVRVCFWGGIVKDMDICGVNLGREAERCVGACCNCWFCLGRLSYELNKVDKLDIIVGSFAAFPLFARGMCVARGFNPVC